MRRDLQTQFANKKGKHVEPIQTSNHKIEIDQVLAILNQSGALVRGAVPSEFGDYYADFGRISSGRALASLGQVYASLLAENFAHEIDVLYSPSYAAISSCVITADKLSQGLQKDILFTFERKTQEPNGGGRMFVGHNFAGREKVVVLDDVLMSGRTVKRSIEAVERAGAQVIGVLVGIDRQERGPRQLTAQQEIELRYKIPVLAVLTKGDLDLAH